VTPPAATAAAQRQLRRSPAPSIPRRVSGPARPGARSAAPAPRPTVAPPLGVRALELVRGLPDARFLERLLRARGAWILVVGGGLMGIVAMQVSLLKLNAGISRAVETSTTLNRQNDVLRSDISRLSASERVQSEAARLGMVQLQAGDVRYLAARPARDPGLAALALRQSPGSAGTDVAAASTQLAPAGVPAPATQSASGAGVAPQVTSPAGAAPAAGAPAGATPAGSTPAAQAPAAPTPAAPTPAVGVGAAGTGGGAGPRG